MSLFLWLFIISVVYVATFKNDFTKETIEKSAPFLIAIGLIIAAFGILTSI